MSNHRFITAVTVLLLGFSGTASADTLIGKVSSMDQPGRSLTLVSDVPNSTDQKDYKLVWEADVQGIRQLEQATLGQVMTVDAEQNMISRSWKVKSVGGAAQIAEKTFLRTDERSLSGTITRIDATGNNLTLRTRDRDDQERFIEHYVTWDAGSDEVLERLGKAKVGDAITVMADQNKVTQHWKANSISSNLMNMMQSDSRLLAGEVRQVDREKKFIILYTNDPSGKVGEQTIVWDDDFNQRSTLENTRVGERLSVHAEQNIITRTWKVTAL